LFSRRRLALTTCARRRGALCSVVSAQREQRQIACRLSRVRVIGASLLQEPVLTRSFEQFEPELLSGGGKRGEFAETASAIDALSNLKRCTAQLEDLVDHGLPESPTAAFEDTAFLTVRHSFNNLAGVVLAASRSLLPSANSGKLALSLNAEGGQGSFGRGAVKGGFAIREGGGFGQRGGTRGTQVTAASKTCSPACRSFWCCGCSSHCGGTLDLLRIWDERRPRHFHGNVLESCWQGVGPCEGQSLAPVWPQRCMGKAGRRDASGGVFHITCSAGRKRSRRPYESVLEGGL
jgi:hypothetical protein